MFNSSIYLVQPPPPSDMADARRIDHLRLRRRMLYGEWLEDARIRLRKNLGMLRADVIGDPDLSSNPFRAMCSAVAALYDQAPEIEHEEGETAVEALAAIIRRAGYWSLMQRVQRDTIGMREMLVRVDVSLIDGMPHARYRTVFADMVEAVADESDPESPVEIRELRRYRTPTGEIWAREVWSIADLSAPYHRIIAAEGAAGYPLGADISELFGLPAGGLAGDAYPARYQNGRPFLPYVLFHASRTGALWDSWEGIEVVEGTLQVSSHWALYGHYLRHASWAQKYIIGAEPAGYDLEGQGTSERRTLPSDASFVAQLVSTGDGQPMVGQWSVSVDPVAFAESIGVYERRLVAFAGLDPADVQRVSGDPRSGYALAISRDGKREAQRRYGPVFQPSDEAVLSVTAALINQAVGVRVLPEFDWKVEYYGLEEEAAPVVVTEQGTAAPAQDTALNGAQVTSLLEVIAAVSERRLPRQSAAAIISRAFGASAEEADAMLGTVGASFFAPEPALTGGDNV